MLVECCGYVGLSLYGKCVLTVPHIVVCLMGICYIQKGDNFLKVISFWVLSGIRTHDIQNHNLTL